MGAVSNVHTILVGRVKARAHLADLVKGGAGIMLNMS
jgi:hypothetical protein